MIFCEYAFLFGSFFFIHSLNLFVKHWLNMLRTLHLCPMISVANL
jgi:hypothetical protein